VPHSHGGRSSSENVVISCALCNDGKDKYTLRQLDVADPRITPPAPSRTAWVRAFSNRRTRKIAISLVSAASRSTTHRPLPRESLPPNNGVQATPMKPRATGAERWAS
jgi:hypothetical protein